VEEGTDKEQGRRGCFIQVCLERKKELRTHARITRRRFKTYLGEAPFNSGINKGLNLIEI